jgi:hypothetical protein
MTLNPNLLLSLPAVGYNNNKNYNLSLAALHELKQIKIEKKFMVVVTGKNLGPAILETPLYITRVLDDHLLNKTNYQELTKLKALTASCSSTGLAADSWTLTLT